MVLQQTAARCAEQGITYVPLVFTAQGGMAKRAEAVLHQLAAKVAEAEGTLPADAFAQIADEISFILARHGARATLRRRGVQRATSTPGAGGASASLWRAARGLPPAHAEEDDLDENEGVDEGDAGESTGATPMDGVEAAAET